MRALACVRASTCTRLKSNIDSMPRTVGEALSYGRANLFAHEIAEPGIEASVLLGYALGGKQRAWLLSHRDAAVRRLDAACYLALIGRRCRHEPSAYIVAQKHWLDMTLAVDRNVLIPRPETELLAEDAIIVARDITAGNGARPMILDVGTGSGAIAIALARALPHTVITAVDTSLGALRTARDNAIRLGATNIVFMQGSLLSVVAGPIGVLVANLPYVKSDDIAGLQPELAFEPLSALDGGLDGLDVVRALLHDARLGMIRGGWILLELGLDQARTVERDVHAIWPDAEVYRKKDLAGRERFLHVHLR
jgi:release factor glutamine methyltransferase